MDNNPAQDIDLILVDGSSYLFRAFHALPPLITSKQQHTGAIKGVINMIRSLVKTYPDSRIAVVFDAKGKTFRNDIYADYKAHRPPMPDELRSQIEPIHAIIKAMGLPILVIGGVEADDVIGTLATRADAAKIRTLISTGDKDLAQLVTQHVTLINTMNNEALDPEGVTKKFGLGPERIVEYLALMGDKADNIPGVPGVGPKTAVKWLQEYGSLEGLLENADKVSGKIGERLRENVELLWLSHELATIKRDVALDVEIEQLVHGKEDLEALHELFSTLEFKTWIKEVESKGAVGVESVPEQSTQATTNLADKAVVDSASVETVAEGVLSQEDLDKCIQQLRGASSFAISLETDGAQYMEAAIIGVALSVSAGQAFYIPLAHDSLEFPQQLDRLEVLARLKPLLEDAALHKVAHDGKYITHVLENYDIALEGLRFDTLTASYVLNSVALDHQLHKIADHYLGLNAQSLEELLGKGRSKLTLSQLDYDSVRAYAGRKADLVLRLSQYLAAQLNETGELAGLHKYYEMALIPVLQRMERNGILIDPEVLGKQSQALGIRLIEVERAAFELAGEEFFAC